jgi:tripartite ATP-independent transporter DctP family solute receptor
VLTIDRRRRALVILGAASAIGVQARADRHLRLVHYGPEGHPATPAAEHFAEGVRRRTGGALQIDIVRNEADPIEQVQSGSVDMGLISWDMLGRLSPLATCVALPFAFRDYAHAHRVVDGPFLRAAAAELASSGMTLLRSWEWGFRQITTARAPVSRPEDLRGLRIRTPAARVFSASIEALGAEPVVVPFSELAAALRSGVVDGQENPIAVIFSKRLYLTQRFIAMVNYIYTSMAHVVRSDVWQALSASERHLVVEESVRAAQLMRRWIRDSELRQLADMKDLGVTVTRPDRSPFKALTRPVYAALRRDTGDAAMDRFLRVAGG